MIMVDFADWLCCCFNLSPKYIYQRGFGICCNTFAPLFLSNRDNTIFVTATEYWYTALSTYSTKKLHFYRKNPKGCNCATDYLLLIHCPYSVLLKIFEKCIAFVKRRNGHKNGEDAATIEVWESKMVPVLLFALLIQSGLQQWIQMEARSGVIQFGFIRSDLAKLADIAVFCVQSRSAIGIKKGVGWTFPMAPRPPCSNDDRHITIKNT